MQLRLSEIDVPASHLLVRGKPKEAFLSHAPKLSVSLVKYFELKGLSKTALFFTSAKRNIRYVTDHLGDNPIDIYNSVNAASVRDSKSEKRSSVMENELIHIRPNAARRLKTRGSERTLPLVGYAKLAMLQALSQTNEEWLYPRYIKTGKCNANSASGSINKWLKRDFDGLTAHCLRHTMRDRLRALEYPMDMIDQIGGWRSVATIGVGYGKGYGTNAIRKVMMKVQI
jgi:integrase